MSETGAAGGEGARGDELRALSPPARCFRILVAPGALFEDLADDPRWFVTLLFGGLLVVFTADAIPSEIGQEMARALRTGARVPPEMAENAGLLRAIALAGSAAPWLVWAFVPSGLTTFVAAFVPR